MADRLDSVVQSSRVVVCVGQGGVGKTSTSATIAMQAAYEGRRAIVLTIDPARRLANALGLPEFGNEERTVDAGAFAAARIALPKGRLTAMMLDIKRTWDEIVARHHPDPARKERLLHNKLYEAMSSALAGSQEYMAMEKLYELSRRKADPLDLIVLDTPPAANAMDFLDAPSRMLDALDNDATRWLLEPYTSTGRITHRLFDAGSSFFIRTIARFTGAELIEGLAELLSCFQGMFEGFRERAKVVRAVLEARDTTFIVIGTPREGGVAEARAFRDRLIERMIKVGAMVLNRATVDAFEGRAVPPARVLEAEIAREGGRAVFARRLYEAAALAAESARLERARADALRQEVTPTPVALLPELPRDIHDLTGLEALRRCLFAGMPSSTSTSM
jgi:anion-transporting  ArsA/GET3 family ATPase